jgi:phosphoglycerate dehydrogenase-like enzyme
VLAHDPQLDAAAAGVEAVSADELYARADFVSLHAPLSEQTHHLVGARELALMKPTAVLLNTSRGGLVDGAALAAALASGRLGGAGLDVFEQEPLAADDPLRRLDTVVLSPHSASFAEEALADARKRALADVLRVLRGEPPLDPVPG